MSTCSYTQNYILIHANPLHAPDINPASFGIGLEHQYKKIGLALSTQCTYMEYVDLDESQGQHLGLRIIGEIKWPGINPTISYMVFPTYWISKRIDDYNSTPTGIIQYYKRIKYGMGIGLIKEFKATDKLSFNLSCGLEFNNSINTGEFLNSSTLETEIISSNSIQPRVRTDFRIRLRL